MAKNGQESGPRSFGDLDCLDRSLGSIVCFLFWVFVWTNISESVSAYVYIYI